MNIDLNPLVDCLAENIPEDSAPHFRSQYDKLIAERDTSDVWRQFALWFLVDPDHGVIRFTTPLMGSSIIMKIAQLYIDNCQDIDAWHKAAKYAKEIADDAKLFANLAKISGDAFFSRAFSEFAAFSSAELFASCAYIPTMARSALEAAATAFAYATNANVKTSLLKNDFSSKRIAVFAQHRILMAKKLLELLQLAPLKETP